MLVNDVVIECVVSCSSIACDYYCVVNIVLGLLTFQSVYQYFLEIETFGLAFGVCFSA